MRQAWSVQHVINRYSEGVSRADWEQALSTYAEGAVWHIADTTYQFAGMAAIREGLELFSQPFSYLVQVNAPAVISVRGDTAFARSAIREGGKFKEIDEAMEGFGWYEDDLTRTPFGWRFTKRVYHISGMHRVPVLGDLVAALPK